MKNTLAFMYLVGYDRKFKEACNSGWGCGYVAIPVTHRLVEKHNERLAEAYRQQDENPDEYFMIWDYLEIPGIDQKITYTQTKTLNGVDYLVAGFDTAHSYNNDSHDMDYVMTETHKILEIVNNY